MKRVNSLRNPARRGPILAGVLNYVRGAVAGPQNDPWLVATKLLAESSHQCESSRETPEHELNGSR